MAFKSKTNPKMRSMSIVATLAAFLLISSVSAAPAPLTIKIELSDVFNKAAPKFCYGPGYPCGSYSECCSEECYMGTCLPGL
ncbi:hypothetical protein EC957_007921 [Mortierella hygrophila]|uniref:Uncharacterized protein n=1 Tax=Mortierella hygrophila TaxID=979708 RepID=A0A9P6FCP0_9FUNG|nr:hypothetical protein EC957_007921 [Mortierella hygrophila]